MRLIVIIRNMGVEHVLYSGVTAGFDLGYFGYLVSDATATYNEGLQQSTESLVGGWLAQVVTTGEIIKTAKQADTTQAR